MKPAQLIRVLFAFGLFVLHFPSHAFQVQVPYSGQLAENGELVNGTKVMQFRILDGTNVRYDSGNLNVQVSNGSFAVLLGNTNLPPLDSSVFDGTALRLRVIVQGTPLSPDIQLPYVAYAVHSVSAITASNADVALTVPANAISSSNIVDGSIPPIKLNTTTAQPGQWVGSGQDGSTAQWSFIGLEAGAGLTGGGSNWPVRIAVDFDSNGSLSKVARSDHNHETNTVQREYVVQYRETDFNFVSRLMEEEGIYYFFKHDSGQNKIIFADSRQGVNHPGPGLDIRAGDGIGSNQPGGNLTLKSGTGSGGGSNGIVALNSKYTLFLADGTPVRATMQVDGLANRITLSGSNTNDDCDGPDLEFQAGAGAGANRPGGSIVLQPGKSTGSGAGGQLIVQGNTNQGEGRFAMTFDPSPASSGSAFKIADNQNPIPQDRVIFNVDYLGTPGWRQPAQGDISGNAATASNAGLLDGFSWHNHPLLRDLNLNGWLANQVVTGAFPGIRLRGMLTDLSGEPRNGLVGVTARIYATPTGGTPLYSEQFTQNISSGVLDVVLGVGSGTTTDDLVSALAPAAGAPFERYLTLQVEPDTDELTPRRRLTAGAFALSAMNAFQLGGQPANSYARLNQPSVFNATPTFAAASGPPFQVASSTVVPNLNCDRIDGISSEALARLDVPNTFAASQVFKGEIVAIEPEFSGSEAPLVIRSYDRLHRLQVGRKSRTYADTLTLEPVSVTLDHDGASLALQAEDGAGINRNGGNVILQPGVATGTGQPGQVKVAGELALADDVFNQLFASLTLKGKLKTEVGSLAPTHAGTPMEFQAGSGAGALQPGGDVTVIAGDGGTDGNGGNIVLQPGLSTGTGVKGRVDIRGPLVLPSAGISGGGAGSGLDADRLDGMDSTALARLAQPNTFTQPQTFDGGVRLGNYFLGRFEDAFDFPPEQIIIYPSLASQPQAERLGIAIDTQNGEVSLKGDSVAPEHTGTSVRIEAGNGAGPDKNGGDITLRPGAATGAGGPGVVRVKGSLVVEAQAFVPGTVQFNGQPIDFDGTEAQWIASTVRFREDSTVRFEAAQGTAPFQVTSSTRVNNLNADKLDGLDSSDILAADTALQAAIAAEVAARTQGDTDTLNAAKLYTDNAVAAEATPRIAADTALQTALNSETTARVTADAALQAALNAETAARGQGDADTLTAAKLYTDNAVAAEATARTAADQTLQTALDAETASRIAAISDHNHTGGINGVQLSHANLSNLGADDHLQYLNRDGSRPMTGTLQLGGNNVTGVGNNLTAGGALTIGATGNGNSLTLQTSIGAGIENVNLTADDNVQITAVNGAITVNKPITGTAAKAGTSANTATPSVANLTALVLENYFSPTTLSGLQDAVNGQTVVLVGGNNPAPPLVPDFGVFKLRSDWQAMPDATLTLVFANGAWLETARSAN